jgi:hypothetical protein
MNLIVAQLLKKSLDFYGTRSFITVFVSRPPDVSSPYFTRYLCKINFNIILPFTPRFSVLSLPFRCSDINMYTRTFLIPPVRITGSLSSHPPLFHFPKVMAKLSLWIINEAPRHEDVWGSGGIAAPFLTSALDGSE